MVVELLERENVKILINNATRVVHANQLKKAYISESG